MQTLGPRVRVVKATPLEAFYMLLVFENGTKKKIDLRPYLHGAIFKPIRDNRELFEDVHIEGGTVAWSNGADIDPDVLYYDLKPAWMEETEAA